LATKTANLKLTVTNSLVRVASLLNQWGTNLAPAILRTNYAQLSWEFPSPGVFGTKSTNIVGSVTNKYTVGPPSKWNGTGGQPSGTNDNLQLSTVPQDIRIARWSIYMLYYDQSLGVHNPTYAKALLADAENRVASKFVAAGFSAYFVGDTLVGTNSLTVNFSNPVGSGTTYSWNFGDGSPAGSGPNPQHIYAASGVYTVTCTVDGTPFTRAKYITVW